MKNLIKLYDKTTSHERAAGRSWYWDAQAFCEFTARKYGLSLSQVCGIVSALSPACSWQRNKQETTWLIESNLEDYEVEPLNFTTYGNNIVKAQRIYSGDDPGQLFSLKTGAKTFNFYHNMLEPHNPDFVTIDRHALTAIDSKLIHQPTKNQYQTIADHFKRSACELGMIPCQFQAIIWIHVKNN